MANIVGQSLGRYHILEQLGEGGMATVYKAFDTRLERDVAIKVIRRDAFPPSQLDRILKRFEREGKSLARLSHLHIIKVIDYGEHDGSPYLVMEYLPGGTLNQCLGRPMPWQDAVKTIIPIAEALEYAHENNIIHRDIKPSNILLTRKGDPMLTDFGIAKILEDGDAATLTGTGIGVGTPEYMAPEQWTGQATAQSDIYSLGVVLYELVTGKKPYSADTPAAILLKQATEPLPRPGAFVRGLPDTMEKVLLKALARRPEDRYLDMASFCDGMKKLLQERDDETRVEFQPASRQQLNASSEDAGETRLQEEAFETRLQDATDAVISSPAVQVRSSEQSNSAVSRLPWSSAWWIVLGWVVGIMALPLINLFSGEMVATWSFVFGGTIIGLSTGLLFWRKTIVQSIISVLWIVLGLTCIFSVSLIISNNILGRSFFSFSLVFFLAGLLEGCVLVWVLLSEKAIQYWRTKILVCLSWGMANALVVVVTSMIQGYLYGNVGWGYLLVDMLAFGVSSLLSGSIAGFVTVWRIRIDQKMIATSTNS